MRTARIFRTVEACFRYLTFYHNKDNLCKDKKINSLQGFHLPKSPLALKPCVCPPFRFLCHRGFSTLHDIDAFRCIVAEISDNLADNKRTIVLIISALKQTIAARSYEKLYNLAGILMSYIYHNLLTINALHLMNVTKLSAMLSDI